jgi:RNA polymerase sigma factor (TIGR02999 family)
VEADDARGQITRLLQRHRAGEPEAFDELVSLVYDHLRRVAQGQLARRAPFETVSATALVHDAYVQLRDERGVDWQDRAHFFAVSARAMRRILVDRARHRHAQKRGGGASPVPLHDDDHPIEAQAERVLAVDQALTSLSQVETRLAQLVECRYFAGMTDDETAAALGVSVRTIQRDWIRARAWLLKTLGDAAHHELRV